MALFYINIEAPELNSWWCSNDVNVNVPNLTDFGPSQRLFLPDFIRNMSSGREYYAVLKMRSFSSSTSSSPEATMLLQALSLLSVTCITFVTAQFETLRFPCSQLVTERLDPLVNPGQVSPHLHQIIGGVSIEFSL